MAEQRNLVDDPFRAATAVTFNAMVLFDELPHELQDRVVLPFESGGRTHWNFLPETGRGRQGIALKEVSHRHLLLAHRLFAASMSNEAYARLLVVMSLEHLLREIDQPRLGAVATDFRDPGNYFLTFFGQPQPDATWGYRLVGHHVSLNVTVLGQEQVVVTPFLFGSEPGAFGPMRPLGDEEDVGFELLRSLTPEQRDVAIVHDVSPPDFATRVAPTLSGVHQPALHGDGRRDIVITADDSHALRYELGAPRGIAARDMSAESRAVLDRLVGLHVGRTHPRMQPHEHELIDAAGRDELHFVWAGEQDAGGGHYYRIEGPVTLIEFNNTEGGANHIHSVWRSPVRDFALDALL